MSQTLGALASDANAGVVRDVHRFGFPSLAKLAEAGGKFLDEAIAMVRAYPAVAQYGA